MENMKKSSLSTIAFISITLMLVSLLNVYPFETASAQGDTMNFTTGETINFTSTTTMSFWSGVSMMFRSGINITFIEVFNGNGTLESCDVIQVQPPFSYTPRPYEWWEVLDSQGKPTGFEFHIDGQYSPTEWHIDNVFPGPIPLPQQGAPFHKFGLLLPRTPSWTAQTRRCARRSPAWPWPWAAVIK